VQNDRSTNAQRKGTLEHLWKSRGPTEVHPISGRYQVDLCSTSVAPLEHLWRGGSRGATDVLQRSTRYLLEAIRFRTRLVSGRYLPDIWNFQRCSKVTFLCTFVLQSLRTGVSHPHWALGVSLTHGGCHFGCRSPKWHWER
jgi:hypothetical protein